MTKRVIACLAALTLALSLLPVTALADEWEVQTSDTTVEVSGGESDALLNTYEGEDPATPIATEGEGETTPTEDGEETTPTTTNVAQIGDTEYATLDAAITDADPGATIELLSNGTITVNSIEKDLSINGNGKTVTIPEQQGTDTGALYIKAKLTFNNTVVNCYNDKDDENTSDNTKKSWDIVLYGSGVLTLDKGSVCKVERSGIYCQEPGGTINIDGVSTMTVFNTHYTAMMAEAYANLNVTEGSTFTVKDTDKGAAAGNVNGLTGFKITVTDANFVVNNCDDQGLVKCGLTLDNSQAEISNNDMGMTGYASTGNVLMMTNRSTLKMENNSHTGIFLWGGNVKVTAGCELTITGTGSSDEGDLNDYSGAICAYYPSPTRTKVTFEDGAIVNITNNPLGGIVGGGTISLGNTTVITNNGGKVYYGGGVYARGDVTMAEGVTLYNNHAITAGDDIYVEKTDAYTGSITLASVGSNWTLDDCGHRIDGWYLDGQKKTVEGEGGATEIAVSPRWNGKTTMGGNCINKNADAYYELYTPSKEAVTAPLALKAAHGYLNNNPPVIRDQYYTVTVNYVDEAGSTIAPSYTTDSLKEGTRYDVTAQDAIVIPGYSYKTTTGDPTTGILNGNKIVTVVYTKTADIDDPDTPTDPGTDIDDPDTPLAPAQPPKTGDAMPLFAALTTLSAAAIVLLAKKREEA